MDIFFKYTSDMPANLGPLVIILLVTDFLCCSVDQTVTVGCSNPSEYLSGRDTYTQDPIKSICNASGKYVLPIVMFIVCC